MIKKITVGLATCGISSGAMPVYNELKKANLPVEKVGCIGMCYNEPIVTVIKEKSKEIYGNVTERNVKDLIDCIKKNKMCRELFIAKNIDSLNFYKKQKRIVMENCGIINPDKIEDYLEKGGYSSLKKALSLTPAEVIKEILDAELRGRGGAGFSTGKKWQIIAKKKGEKYLICNGDEGDPGAFMNRALMESDPFRIIEGMTIGSYATNAKEGIIYTRAEYPLAIKTLQNAIDLAYKNNLLGKNILGKKGFDFELKIIKGAGAFVCGEETAMIRSIEGKRGHPMSRPPYPGEKGLYRKPTNVNNVGTWGHVTTIFKIGLKEYKKIGTKNTKGTKILCLTGKVKRTGVIEVPFGIKIKEIVFSIGGGCPDNTKFKALLSGGPAGGCLTKKDLENPLDFEVMASLGTIMGSGGFIITNNTSCMVSVAKYFTSFTQEESCGKCTPCREGTKRLLEMLTQISRGNGTEETLKRIQELAEFVQDTSLCGLGQNAPNPIISTLKHFKKEYIMHIKEKKCSAGVCEALLSYTINENCVGCGACSKVCPVNAIEGKQKKMHIIDQEKCIKCGQCYIVCAFKAIEKK